MTAPPKNHLLMIVHRIPYPPDKGDKIRSYHQFCFLKAKGWKIHLCTFIDDPNDLKYVGQLEKQCETSAFFRIRKIARYFCMLRGFICGKPLSIGAFYSNNALRYVRNVLNDYPIKSIFCFSSPTAEYLFQSDLSRYNTVMDLIDVDSDKWRLYAESHGYLQSLIYALEAKRLSLYEKRIVRKFDTTILVSEAEAQIIRNRIGGTTKIHSIPNGVDIIFFHPLQEKTNAQQKKDNCSLVFCGLMDYYPNEDAVAWFANEVLPIVRAHLDKAEFLIVGARPSRKVFALENQPGVKVVGRVDDVRPHIWESTISVAPLRMARGIQNKVLEAMAMGKPIVATEQAYEGIDAVPGRDLVVTKANHEAFASAIINIWEHPNMARDIGRNARKTVEAKYNWNALLQKLHVILGSSD